jgi:hypothetical protein
MTAFPLVPSDGGRAKAGFDPPASDRDCVTRALSNGLPLPYDQVHPMVDALAKEYGTTAETGAHFVVTARILTPQGWQNYSLGPNARLTLEDLRVPLSNHSVLIVELNLGAVADGNGTAQGLYHVTTVIDGAVHDIPSMGTGGYAHTHRVTNVFGRPPDVKAPLADEA